MEEFIVEKSLGARVKFLAVGSAACRVLNCFFRNSGILSDLCLAMDTDIRCLEPLDASLPKFCLGKSYFRGLSSGGDEKLVQQVFEKESNVLEDFCSQTDVLVLLTGLGGGTGGGIAVRIAQLAVHLGAFVLNVPILPFSFEGQTKGVRAQTTLKSLQAICDLVVPFPNDSLFQTLPESATIKEAFTAGDAWLNQLLATFFNYITNIHTGAFEGNFNNFIRHFSNKPDFVFWGFGKSSGEHAVEQALQNLFKCPYWQPPVESTPIHSLFVYAQLGSDIPLAALKDLHYELQCCLGTSDVQVLNACTESKNADEAEIFVLGAIHKQNLKTTRFRKKSRLNTAQQIQFDFEDEGNEAYWDTPTYLRLGIKLDA